MSRAMSSSGIRIAFLAVCCSATALAQVVAPDTLGVRPPSPERDSVAAAHLPYQRVIAGRPDSAAAANPHTKSTGLAMGLSAIFPGAGQVYNGSYWKVPIITGLGIYFISTWLDYNRRYLDYKEKYTNDPSNLLYLRVREFYHDQRDTYTWYFLILYFANIADAYVDASLYEFNVGEDLSIRMMPVRSDLPDRSPQLQFRLTF